MSIDDNRQSRETVLSRVRAALHRDGPDDVPRAAAHAYIAAHRRGPQPAVSGDLVERFLSRASDMASTVERVPAFDAVAAAVGRYVAALDGISADGAKDARAGVCWPEFADLDWQASGLAIEARPTMGQDRLGITGTFCAIAETGTLVVLTGQGSPTATTLLPDTHVAVVHADRIVSGMEEAFALVRRERGCLPRAVNLISGPSRTGDIEQTIVLGAHGPYQVHIVVLG